MVVKKDNTREMYDRAKIEAGILHSCHKRPVSQGQISALIDDVENNLFNREEREISTAVIGELVMERLKDLDVVTYVRFASVYREFKDVDTFMEELQKIKQRNVPSYEPGKNGEETRCCEMRFIRMNGWIRRMISRMSSFTRRECGVSYLILTIRWCRTVPRRTSGQYSCLNVCGR